MKKQLELFFTALMFYSRIPCPAWIDHNDDKLNKATRYFPLIGWIVGAISFIVFYSLHLFLPVEIAVIGSLVAGMLTTGAFHEDGLADFFDGFGGGWTKEKILEIMKDSRVGTYGMVATILQLALKYFTLVHLIEIILPFSWYLVALVFIVYHSIARWTAIQLCFVLEYVREDETSKAKPIAKKHGRTEIIGVYVFGLLPLFILVLMQPWFAAIIIPLVVLVWYFKGYLFKWLGGYTGDCLGAVEQIAEVISLISILAIWNCM